MRSLCFLILATGAVMAADNPAKEDSTKTELDKLKGTWLTVSLVNDGKTLIDEKNPPKEGTIPKVVYDGTKWMLKQGDKTFVTGQFKIDPAKKPKQIDFMEDSDTKNDKLKLGIYEIDGDTIKFCLALPGKPRPTEFTSKEGSGHSLGTMKREKP